MGKKSVLISLVLLLLLALVNLLPVFAPEIGFDALWYHLTLPKLYLWYRRWYFEGGLLYYSAMPRLTETLYIPLLAAFGTAGPKMLQYLSGLGVVLILYRYLKPLYDQKTALLGTLIFYAVWLVGWQSSSAYIDLFRTLLETAAVVSCLSLKKPLRLFRLSLPPWFVSGFLFALAVGTKWHALPNALVFSLLFNLRLIPVVLLFSSPWMAVAWRYTGNPLYPLLEPFMHQIQFSQVPADYFRLDKIIIRLLKIPYFFIKPFDDPLSPLLTLLMPLAALYHILSRRYTRLFLYGLFGLCAWQLLPPPSTRYFLPFLPVWVILIMPLFKTVLKPFLPVIIWSAALLILFLRLQAVRKFLPVVTGRQTQVQFLTNVSSRLPDTFIDSDGYYAANLKGRRVLTDIHNLYYFPYPVVHTSFADNTSFDYFVTFSSPPPANAVKVHRSPLGVNYFLLND